MSNKVYFSQSSFARRPLRFLVRGLSKVLYYTVPGWAARTTKNLLLVPQGKKPALSDMPDGFSVYGIQTMEGRIQCYDIGSGPIVVLTHGWSGGAYQFFSLMQALADAGYRGIAFDHPGHGYSDGKYSSAPQFIRAFQGVLDHLAENESDSLAGVITHSMGSIAAVNAESETLHNIPLCLIAPVFQFRRSMEVKIQEFGLYPKLFNDMLDQIKRKFGVSIDELELDSRLPDYVDKALILHDRQDRFADVEDSIRFCENFPQTQLFLSRGFGHGRIIQAQTTWEMIARHLLDNTPDIKPLVNAG